MSNNITDFHELCCPRVDNIGGQPDRKDWVAFDIDNKMTYYLLNGKRNELGDLLQGLQKKNFHFDTEDECHAASGAYYLKHKVIYPYLDEWYAAIQKRRDDGSVSDDSGSQIMEFI